MVPPHSHRQDSVFALSPGENAVGRFMPSALRFPDFIRKLSRGKGPPIPAQNEGEAPSHVRPGSVQLISSSQAAQTSEPKPPLAQCADAASGWPRFGIGRSGRDYLGRPGNSGASQATTGQFLLE